MVKSGTPTELHIGIDAHSLSDQQTGVATYVSNLVRSIRDMVSPASVTLYVDKLPIQPTPFQTVVIPRRPLWTSFWLPLYLGTHKKPDVMLYPAHNLPRYHPGVSVVTIHDLAFELFPDYFTPKDLRRLTTLTRYAAKHADHILADSQATKDDIVRLYGIPDIRITTVRLGYDGSHFRHRGEEEVDEVKRKYHLSRPYIIAVGTLQKRKNHVTLIRALQHLHRQGIEIDLVVSGAKGWYYDEIFKLVEELGVQDFVHFIGYADYADLPALYSGAVAGALVSLYEGFGLPVLESLACGTPLVLARNSSLPEVGGDACLYIDDPLDVDAAATMLRILITQPEQREALVAKAPQHLQQFSWEKTAQQTIDVLTHTMKS